MESKKTDDAIAAFHKALELDPQRVDSHHKLGVLLAEQGKVAEAIPYFRKAVELDPNLTWSHANLAWYLATAADPKLRDPQAAVIHARKATELQPDHPNHWRDLGAALLRAGDYKAAALTLEKVEVMTKDIHRHRFFLAMAYWQLGEQGKARLTYEQAAQWMDLHQSDNEHQRRFRAEAAELLGIAKPTDAKPTDAKPYPLRPCELQACRLFGQKVTITQPAKTAAAQNESRRLVRATAWGASGGHGTRTRNPLRGA